MIYKFKVWSWKPMYTEIYLAAPHDEEALKTFNALDKNTFVWIKDEMKNERSTYEVIKDAEMEPRKDTENTESRTES